MSTNPTAPPPKVISQLLQNHRLGKPITGASQLATAQDANGDLQLFSIGSGHVYWLYRDPTSDTGWAMQDLQFPATAIFLGAVANPDNSVTVVASAGNGVYLLNLTAASAQSLPAWVSVSGPDVNGIRTGHLPDGTAAICIYSGHDSRFYMLNQTASGTYGWSDPLPGSSQNQPVTGWKFSMVYNTNDWSGPYPGVIWTGPFLHHSKQGILSANWSDPSEIQNELEGDFSILAPVINTAVPYDVLALNTSDSSIYYLATPVGSKHSDYVPVRLTKNVSCTTVAGGCSNAPPGSSGPQLLTEVFSLDTNGFLYRMRQMLDPTTGWDDFICLNEDLAFTQIAVGVNGEANSEIFAVTTDGILYHITEDPATSDWSFDDVEYDLDGVLEDVPTYQTIIQVFDANGMPAPFVNATLTPHSGDDVLLEINGEELLVGKTKSWAGVTNLLGRIVVNCATDGLSTPALDLWYDGMDNGDVHAIDASGVVQETLRNVTGDELINNGVISSEYQADADEVAQAVCSALKILPPPPNTQTVKLHPQSDPRVVRFVPRGTAYLPGAATPIPSYWSFDITTGRPGFQVLDADGAAALIAQANALPEFTLKGSGKTLYDAWGDVASSIKQGAAEFVSCIVSAGKKAGELAEVTIKLLIKEDKYVFNGVITVAEQVLDLAGEILSAVKATFEKLFNWLGFIFDWDNILRSQEAVVHVVNELFDFFTGAAATIKTNVDNHLVSFANNQIPQMFSTLQSKIDPTLTFGALEATNTQSPPGFDTPAAQLIGTHLIVNSSQASPVSTALSARFVADADSSALQDVLDKVNNFGETYGVNEKVQDALAKFTATPDSSSQYLQLTVSGVVDLIEAAVLAALAGVQIIVDAVLDAIVALLTSLQNALDAEWDIPIVSDLYKRMTTSEANPDGLPLTVLGLVSLLVAMPATVVYTAVNQQAPFPDDDSLTQFTTNFTSAMLLQNSGLGSSQSVAPRTSLQPAEVIADSSPNPWPMIFAFMNAGTLVMMAAIEPIIDAQLPEGVDSSGWTNYDQNVKPLSQNTQNILSVVIMSLEIAEVGLSIPWLDGAKSWSLATSDGWLCVGWTESALKTLVDGCVLCVAQVLPRQIGDFGSYFEAIGGFLTIVPPFGYWITGGFLQAPLDMQISAVGGVTGGLGDLLRILRLKSLVVETEGASLGVLAITDVVGNLVQAGCEVGAAIEAAKGN